MRKTVNVYQIPVDHYVNVLRDSTIHKDGHEESFDFAVLPGTVVRAARGGLIVSINSTPNEHSLDPLEKEYSISIQHRPNEQSDYFNVKAIKGLKEGRKVEAGHEIGISLGSTDPNLLTPYFRFRVVNFEEKNPIPLQVQFIPPIRTPCTLPDLTKLNRVFILGNGGTGKSSLARVFEDNLGLPVIETDDILFAEKYSVLRTTEEQDPLIRAEAAKDKWVIEGKVFHEVLMQRADLIIWLDYDIALLEKRVRRRDRRKRTTKNKYFWFLGTADEKANWKKQDEELERLVINTEEYRNPGGFRDIHGAFLERSGKNFYYITNEEEFKMVFPNLKYFYKT